PHPSPLVEVEKDRLGDDRLRQDLLDFQIFSDGKFFQRFRRAERMRTFGGFAGERLGFGLRCCCQACAGKNEQEYSREKKHHGVMQFAWSALRRSSSSRP